MVKNAVYAHGDYPAPKSNQVGLFYFLWLGEHGRHAPFDVSKIVAGHPDAGSHPNADYWGGIGTYHHWGEPFYGYYYSDDEWVVRRHIKLIMQAGVDFLFFDVTNALIYEGNAKLVMRVLQEYHDDNWRVPKVMFYTNTASGATAQALYETIYKPKYCADTWYYIDGKPVIVAFPDECSAEVREFFTIKLPQWPNEPIKVGGWPWMDFTRPQRVFTNEAGEPECINVSVAQHPQLRFGDSVLYGETANCGRAFHNGENDKSEGAYKKCFNMAEQFERAIEADVPYTLVTGWNEWIAGRWQGSPARQIMFVDCANYEYSRDIEMMRGGYFDSYYVALCDYVARLKGSAAEVICRQGETVRFHGFTDGAMPRRHEGFGGRIYENTTARRSLRALDVTNCGDCIKLTLVSHEAIDPSDTSGAFMQIFAKSGERSFVINAAPDIARGTTTIECGVDVREIPLTMTDHSISVTLPTSSLTKDAPLYLKAADSRLPYTSPESFYDQGDSIPLGHQNFCVILK